MNFTDLIIIYLTCGAPFGVYFFFQNRENYDIFQRLLKSLLIGLFWIPTGFRFLHQFVIKKLLKSQFAENNSTDSSQKVKITQFERVFSKYLLKNNCEISLFDFRETFERYVGLTLSIPKENEIIITDSDFFRISNHQNFKLGEICLQRRNRLRLQSHQTQARQDLFQLFAKINSNDLEAKIIKSQAFEFFGVLEDFDAQNGLTEIFCNLPQTENSFPVNPLEKEVWNSKEHKPSPANQPVLNLHPISATTLMSKPD